MIPSRLQPATPPNLCRPYGARGKSNILITALNHPTPRKTGAAWGPRSGRGYHLSRPRHSGPPATQNRAQTRGQPQLSPAHFLGRDSGGTSPARR